VSAREAADRRALAHLDRQIGRALAAFRPSDPHASIKVLRRIRKAERAYSARTGQAAPTYVAL
jgi:hypothetical protein